MDNYIDRIEKAREAIKKADYIVIGGGAGLSDAAGLKFYGERFTSRFADFIEKYDMEDLYTSSFYPFETMEEKWAYWARHIYVNRFEVGATPLYEKLYELVKNKKYFVITTNVEKQFYKAKFDNEKIFATQGDYGYIQCAKACHDKLYYDEDLVNEMISKTKDCKIPSELVPKCPVCKGDMEVNVRKDSYFVQDDNWYKEARNYEQFIKEIKDKKVVFLELGVGFNTPTIIRFPFEKLTYNNPNATLIRINKDFSEGMEENKAKTISFGEDMMKVISEMGF